MARCSARRVPGDEQTVHRTGTIARHENEHDLDIGHEREHEHELDTGPEKEHEHELDTGPENEREHRNGTSRISLRGAFAVSLVLDHVP
jgi:hypothetical protein